MFKILISFKKWRKKIKNLNKMHYLNFVDFGNSIKMIFDFDSPEIRFFKGNKKLITKFLIPL